MEARSKWSKKREAMERYGAGEKGNPTHKRKHNAPDNKSNMGAMKGYQVISSKKKQKKTIGNRNGVPFSINI